MNVAIVGCGLIGGKRAQTLGCHRLLICADVVPELARALAADHPDCRATGDVRRAIEVARIANDALSSILTPALSSNALTRLAI